MLTQLYQFFLCRAIVCRRLIFRQFAIFKICATEFAWHCWFPTTVPRWYRGRVCALTICPLWRTPYIIYCWLAISHKNICHTAFSTWRRRTLHICGGKCILSKPPTMDCLVMLLISTVPCDLILSCSWRICSICSKYTQLNVYVILAWMGRVSDNSENIQLCTASHSNQPTYQTQQQQLAFVCFNRACLDSLFPRRSDRLTFKVLLTSVVGFLFAFSFYVYFMP